MAAVIQSVRHIAALANTVRWVLGRVKTIGAFTSKGEQGRDNDIYSRTDGALGLNLSANSVLGMAAMHGGHAAFAKELAVTLAHEMVGHGADDHAGRAIGLKDYASAVEGSPVHVKLTMAADGTARFKLGPVAQELMAAYEAGRLPGFAQTYKKLVAWQKLAAVDTKFTGEALKALNDAVREATIEAWPRVVEALVANPTALKAIAPQAYAWGEAALKARSAEQMGGILSGRTPVKGVGDGRAANAKADRRDVSAADGRPAAQHEMGRSLSGRQSAHARRRHEAPAGPATALRPAGATVHGQAGSLDAGVEPAPRQAAPGAAGAPVEPGQHGRRDGGLDAQAQQRAPTPKAKVDYKLLGRLMDALKGRGAADVGLIAPGQLPVLLPMFGSNARPVTIDMEHLRHIRSAHPDITLEDIAALPDLMQRPRAVLEHESGSLNFILDARDAKGNPLLVAIKPANTKEGGFKVTAVSTLYGLDASGRKIIQALRDGQVRYLSQEGLARAQELLSTASIAAQSPEGATTSLAKPAQTARSAVAGGGASATMTGKPANARAKNNISRATFYSDRAVGAFRSGQNWRAMQETLEVPDTAQVPKDVAFQRDVQREDAHVQESTATLLKEPKGTPGHAGGVVRQVLHEYIDLTPCHHFFCCGVGAVQSQQRKIHTVPAFG